MTDERPAEAEVGLAVSDYVFDRRGHPRWVVTAYFVGAHGAEPRCVDYRVRVVPEMPSRLEAMKAARRIVAAAQEHTSAGRHPDFLAGEVSAPSEGIPRRVFEEMSQSRILAKIRAKAARHPDRFKQSTHQLLARQERRRVGRPPVRSLGEKLAVLSSAERAYAAGRTLDDVAIEHSMSRSAVRDLLRWARHDAVPPLFTGYGPGRRGGELTPEARALLREGVD